MIKIFVFVFLFFGLSNRAICFQTARQLSFAGSGALNPNAVDALNLNPATLSMQAGFSFGGGYNFGDVSSNSSRGYYAWFKDSVSSAFKTKRNKEIQKNMEGLSGFPVAAAFVFSKLETEDQSILDYTNYTLGLSTLVTRRMSFGLTLIYFDGATGQEGSFGSVDLGLLYWFSPRLRLGLSGLDVLSTLKELVSEELKPQRVRLSAAYSISASFEFYVDAERIFSGEFDGDIDFGAGFETSPKEYFSLRLGLFKRQALDDLDFGAGISFTGPKLQINYGFRRNSGRDTFLNSIDFSIPLW